MFSINTIIIRRYGSSNSNAILISLSNAKLKRYAEASCNRLTEHFSQVNHTFSTYSIQKSDFNEFHDHGHGHGHDHGRSIKREIHQWNNHQAKEINHRIINDSHNWKNLLKTFELHGDQFNIINWATFMNRLGRNEKRDIFALKNDTRYKIAISCVVEIFSSDCMRTMASVQAVANIVHAFGKLNEPIRVVFDVVEKESDWILRNGSPQAISNIAWAHAVLRIPAPNFFNLIDKNAGQIIDSKYPHLISIMAWSCATLNSPAPNLFHLINENASSIINNARPQNISNIAWASAKLSIQSPIFFDMIEKNASRIISTSKPQEISNIALAFAKLSIPAPNVFRFIDENASNTIMHGKPQAISNIAWSCATLSFPAPNFFDLIEKNAAQIINTSKPQEISNIALAFAKLHMPAPNFFNIIDNNMSRMIQKWNAQDISNTAWAFATLSIPGPMFFLEIEKNISRIATDAKPQAISSTLWAFTELGYNCVHLPKLIDVNSLQLIKQMNSREISSVALAFAKLDFKSYHYFNNLENNIDVFLESMNAQQICNILWSLAILDLMDQNNTLLNALWKKVISLDSSKLHKEELSQIARLPMHAKANSIKLDLLPAPLQSRIEESVAHQTSINSRSEDEYSELLQEIGFHHSRKVSPCAYSNNGNMLLIDFACKDRMIAVEFNGFARFLTALKDNALPSQFKENGPTKAKQKLLERFGWKVVNISYMKDEEMNKKGKNKWRDLKKEFLKQELSKVGAFL